jgi:hypothetical protein
MLIRVPWLAEYYGCVANSSGRLLVCHDCSVGPSLVMNSLS